MLKLRPKHPLAKLLVIALLLSTVVAPAAANAAAPGQRIDLRVLLLSADGSEPTFQAWKSGLQREGVPFDAIVAKDAPPITAETLADGTTKARYQAVVLATGGLVYFDGSSYTSALSTEEWTALANFEAAFGIRRVTAYVYPSAEYGLNPPASAGDLNGQSGTLTADGRSIFTYLAGPIPIEDPAYGYLATPVEGAAFRTHVTGPGGSSLVGVLTRPDGREDLVSTVDGNPGMLHTRLLMHGMITWATRGVYLGYQRNYLGLHIDDVFLPNDRWNVETNSTPEDGPNQIRMVPADVTRALNWSKSKGIRLDLAFNGAGSDEAVAANGSDPLTTALLANKAGFGWINHTYSHLNLDDASLTTLVNEIRRNINWAENRRLPFNAKELVTGEHSGLKNPNMPSALSRTGVNRIAADASREPNLYTLGPALALPRHPSNIYYNVGTFDEQLDEYNYVYFENCQNAPTTTCLTQPATWQQYVDSEQKIMLGHVLGNDPRPHYMHQSNLAEQGTFYPIVDTVIDRYRGLFLSPLQQPTMTEAANLLNRQQVWAGLQGSGAVTAYLLDGLVYISSTVSTEVPVTGTTFGTSYGGQRSGWRSVAAGTQVVLTPENQAALATVSSSQASAAMPAQQQPTVHLPAARVVGEDPAGPAGAP